MDKETKNEFKKVKSEFEKVDDEFKKVDDEFKKVRRAIAELKEEIREIKENMFTKKDWAEYMTRFEDVLQEIRDMRTHRVSFDYRFAALDDTVVNHEKRIRKIEGRVGVP